MHKKERYVGAIDMSAAKAKRDAVGQNLQSRGGMPMYALLLSVFRQRIENGDWALDEQIPTLDELCVEFGAARVTVRHAIGLLEAEGLIGRYRGRGTFVLKKPESAIWYQVPMTWADNVGQEPDIEFDLLESRVADGAPFHFREVGSPAPSYHLLRRLLLRHHVPYCVGTTYIEKDLFDRIGGERFDVPVPLKIIDQSIRGGIAHAEQTIRVVAAELQTAKWLDLPPGAPLLAVVRSVVDQNGTLIYESLGHFRGDFVEIHSDLR
ncbi:GntR family transcriptional regulator [Sphingopyxis indica]|uniref:GntR family transcriptional regulator n=1 Tax=Sphingopyxis indica TaxID=436663 RepID=UPI002938D9A1|nr:GntR family transcriptional regulator [Sphingopyxis indica]WOF43060.1 GntR family transcriptional regulator [Sphingopyxis indica]